LSDFLARCQPIRPAAISCVGRSVGRFIGRFLLLDADRLRSQAREPFCIGQAPKMLPNDRREDGAAAALACVAIEESVGRTRIPTIFKN
jgi:hypothetical protein